MIDLENFTPPGPVASQFMDSDALIRMIMGPFGSGKSIACLVDLYCKALLQPPDANGVKQSRYVVCRMTIPEMRSTIVKTFQELFPPSEFGELSHDLKVTWKFPYGEHKVEIDWAFMPLSEEADINRILGLEATGFYLNESLIDTALIGKLVGRLRYPAVSRWKGVVLDTNPFDTDSPMHGYFVTGAHEGVEFYHQPGAFQKDQHGNYVGENLNHLNQTPATLALPLNHPDRIARGLSYYENMLQTLSPEDAKRLVHSQFGVSREGMPCYSQFDDSRHCVALKFDQAMPLLLGSDFGMHSATVIGQQAIDGQLRILAEFCTEGVGTLSHHEKLKHFLASEFPGYQLGQCFGDEAGNQTGMDGRTVFAALRQMGFVTYQPARDANRDPQLRIECVNRALERNTLGLPALSIDNRRCPTLRRAAVSGYHYKRVRGSTGRHEYTDKVVKNESSHIAEALAYLCWGLGFAMPHVMAGRGAGGISHAKFMELAEMRQVSPPPREWNLFN